MTTENLQPTEPVETPPATPPVVELSPDEIELQEATAALKAEEDAAKGELKTEIKPEGTTPPASVDPTAKPVVEAKPADMIPKARFDDVNNAKNEAERQAAYWRGQAEARSQAQPTVAQQPPPVVETPEQKIAAIRTERSALAKKFDDGELTASEWDAQRLALEDKETTVREAAMLERLRPAAQPPAPAPTPAGESLTLSDHTARLETAHPYVSLIDNDADFEFLKSRAAADLIAQGKLGQSGVPVGEIQIYEMRKRVAELSDQFGPAMTGKTLAEVTGQPQTPPVQTPPALSPEAQARASKLNLQATLPPDITAMTGTPGAPSGEVSDAQLENMSDEDIGKLPVGVRNKLLGIT